MTSCHIAIKRLHQSKQSGNTCRIRIEMRIPPNHSLVVKRSSTPDKREEHLQTVLRKAFDSAHRQLKQLEHKTNAWLKEIMTELGWEDRRPTKSAQVDV